MQIFLVALAMLVALIALKFYIYKRLLCHMSFFAPRKRLAITFLIVVGTSEFIFFIGESIQFFTKQSIFNSTQYMVVSSSLVIIYALLMVSICAEIGKGMFCMSKHLQRKTIKQHNAESTTTCLASQPNRRKFLQLMFDSVLAFLFVFISLKSLYNALNIPPVRQVHIKIKSLKKPKTIVMISDVHIGKTLGKKFLQDVINKINTLKADIVVIVGDLVDDQIERVKADLEPIKDLQSTEGVYYVTGNHEYYHGVDSITAYLESINIHVLHNKNIELEDFSLAGVSDLMGIKLNKLKPDLQKAKQGLNPNKPSILLAHQPKFVRQNDVSDFDLVLSGHTHAGQVFPLSFFVWLDQHYIHGHYTLLQNPESPKTTQLYVSSGVGFWGPAVRFLAPSEIVQINLEGE